MAAIGTVKGSEAETRTAVNDGRATSRVGLWGRWPELRPRRFVTVEGVRDGAFEKADDDHGAQRRQGSAHDVSHQNGCVRAPGCSKLLGSWPTTRMTPPQCGQAGMLAIVLSSERSDKALALFGAA